jgi:hypothetical protein
MVQFRLQTGVGEYILRIFRLSINTWRPRLTMEIGILHWNGTRVESEACLNPVVTLICSYPPPPQTNAWEKSNSSPRPGLDPTSPAARRKPTGHRPTNNVLGQQLEGRRLACDGAIRVWKSNGSCSLSLSSVTVIVADLWSLNGSVNLYYYCVMLASKLSDNA